MHLTTARDRPGYALIAALWLVVTLATVATAASLSARQAVTAAANRTALQRAGWRADGCAALAVAALDSLLVAERAHPGGAVDRWRALDEAFAAAADVLAGADVVVARDAADAEPGTELADPPPLGARCVVRLTPAGARADLNALNADGLRTLFHGAGLAPPDADALSASLVAWRLGASAAGEAGEAAPGAGPVSWRDGRPLAALAQLREVPGFDAAAVAAVAAVGDVEPGRVFLGRAPAAALATLPGFGPEVVAAAVRRQQARASLAPAALAEDVSPPAARTLLESLGPLAARATEDPDAWVLSATAAGAARAPLATVELRLARAGWRVAVMRRRSSW